MRRSFGEGGPPETAKRVANAKIDCPEHACDRKRQNPVEITGQKMALMKNEKSALAFANFSGIFNGEGVETCT